MANQSQIERLYDYFDAVSEVCIKANNVSYLEGLIEALNLLLDNQTNDAYEPDVYAHMLKQKTNVEALIFDKESVRKAIQLSALKGFKQMQVTNAMMTPDSIGFFVAYLIKKLMPTTPRLVLDPLVGTGNLIATVINQIPEINTVIGVDSEPLMASLARNILDALEINNQIYLQDTLSYHGPQVDVIITDLPVKRVDSKSPYFPYLVIMHHLKHLKVHHYLIALIENDFFEQHNNQIFKQQLLEEAFLFGLIKLDESLFKTHPKSILILQKKNKSETSQPPFLLVDLPAFTDKDSMQKAMGKIELWFKQRKVD